MNSPLLKNDEIPRELGMADHPNNGVLLTGLRGVWLLWSDGIGLAGRVKTSEVADA